MKPHTEITRARMTPDLVARLDRLAQRIAPAGSRPSRAAAVRAAVLAGLRVLEDPGGAR